MQHKNDHWLFSRIRTSFTESWMKPSISFFSTKSFKLTNANKQTFVSPVGYDTKWIFNSVSAYCD